MTPFVISSSRRPNRTIRKVVWTWWMGKGKWFRSWRPEVRTENIINKRDSRSCLLRWRALLIQVLLFCGLCLMHRPFQSARWSWFVRRAYEWVGRRLSSWRLCRSIPSLCLLGWFARLRLLLIASYLHDLTCLSDLWWLWAPASDLWMSPTFCSFFSRHQAPYYLIGVASVFEF